MLVLQRVTCDRVSHNHQGTEASSESYWYFAPLAGKFDLYAHVLFRR